MHRVVGVDAHATVDVNDGVGHAMSGIGGPEGCGGDLGVGRQVLAESPRRLCQSQPQSLDVDVAVRQPLSYGLEAADRAVELLTRACILGGQLESAVQDAELKRAAAQYVQYGDPADHVL